MNNHTAALILIKDLVVVQTYFMGHEKQYTYVSRESWLPSTIEEGTMLLCQSNERNAKAVLRIACFKEFGDITDLDLDDENIIYRFALGVIPQELHLRNNEAINSVQEVKKAIRQQRINGLREAVKANLLALTSPTT